MSDIVKEILRTVCSSLQIPTIIILILLILLTILMLGSFVAEIFTERKSLKMNIPGLVDQLQGKNSTQMKEAIEASGLLNRQKESARELINRTSYNDDTREALARQLIADEDIRYNKIVKITDLVARIAPMFGLMGTLIPLGPGLIALGQGDTNTLSASLLIAFDTTVAGLVSGAVSYVISGIRKNWYEEYMIGLETIMETILDAQSDERKATGRQLRQSSAGGRAPAQQKGGAAQKNRAASGAGRPARTVSDSASAQPRGQQGQTAPGTVRGAQPQGMQQRQGSQARPAAQGRPAAPGARTVNEGVQQIDPQEIVPEINNLVEGGQPHMPGQGAVGSRRETMTQPIQSQAVRPDAAQMSRSTQMQPTRPEPDSKMDHTMVQMSFQEEVRAAEQAMLEAQRYADQGGRQVLHRPDER